MAAILVVDDESGVRDLVSDALRIAGHEPTAAQDGGEGLALLRRGSYDLAIVDINMPGVDGFTFVETLRERGESTPVLLLSARDAAPDVTRGLRAGADDYVRKPFGLEELLLRVEAILRRTSPTGDEAEYTCGPLALSVDRHEVSVDGELVDVSATEFHLLEVLISRKNRLLTREQLLKEVWGIDFDSETSVLDTYISYLRKKVNREGFSPIVTVRGVGYKLVDTDS